MGSVLIEFGDEFEAQDEQALTERHVGAGIGGWRVFLEIFEIGAEIENEEELFVFAGAEEIGAEAGAAADHLPELGFGADELEEDEVQDFGHVDASVEHIDGDGDMRHGIDFGKTFNEGLGVFGFEGDDAGELAHVLRVIGVETLFDEAGVVVVFGEDDGFAEAVAIGYALAAAHEGFEDFVDCVFIKEPAIDGFGFDAVGRMSFGIVVPFDFIPGALFFLGGAQHGSGGNS